MHTTALILALLALAACAASAEAPAPRLPARFGDLDTFNAAAFRTPDSFFRPSLMWIWNDRLSADELARQIADMGAHGAGGPMPVPEPKEFRPTWMPTRLEPGYLSPDFVALTRRAVDECRRAGLRFWLYDEGGWPSGSVCGKLVRENPDLARQVLERVEEHPAAGTAVSVPRDGLAGFLFAGGKLLCRLAPGESLRVQAPGARWLLFRARKGGSYPDLLNPRATDTFLRMTHEVYAKALGADFGATIPAIFTDEPQASAMPWTDDLLVEFRRAYRYDLAERLPSLFEGETDGDRQVRIDYHDWWSRRFADAYLGRIQTWCHAHKLLSTGHLNGEDETLGAIRYGFGNLMRCMRRLDIPGVDVIWRQLWPGQANGDFPKHASSVAHQEGGRWAITESFAVYGSGLTPAQMKWIADYQMVRGINLMDLVCYPYSTADWLVGGERPHFHNGDPLWDWMPLFNDYAGRMGYLMSLGRPAARTALYFPARDIWAGGKHAENAAAEFDRLARLLLECQCDYDLVDDDVLGRAETTVGEAGLAIGPMRYRTVIVPPCGWMPPASSARLAALADAGGRVLCVAGTEPTPLPHGAERIAPSALPARLDRLVATGSPAPGLRATGRRLRNGNLFLLTNEDTRPLETSVRLSEAARPMALDPQTGEMRSLDAVRKVPGGWEVDARLPFAGSLVLLCPAGRPRVEPDPGRPGAVLRELSGTWTVAPEVSLMLGDGGLERRVGQGTAAKPAPLGDWRPVLGDGFSGTALYETPFDCTEEEARQAVWLDLGEVRYVAQVELNGHDLGRLAWEPWRVRVAGRVHAGRNTLRVRVANTMANQYLTTKALARRKPEQLGPYHPRALKFEPDSLPSGLFGPVRICTLGGR